MHSIDQVDVRMARGTEHNGVALGPVIAIGVGGLVHRAHIGLRFHDAANQGLALPHAHKVSPQEIPGNGDCIADIFFLRKL